MGTKKISSPAARILFPYGTVYIALYSTKYCTVPRCTVNVLLMYRAVLFVFSKGGERGPKSKLGPPAQIHEWELLI